MQTDLNLTYLPIVFLPDGNGGFAPCPALLTEQEAIRYLRLDVDGVGEPEKTLEYYRNSGQIIAIKVGRKNRYRRVDLDMFLAEKSQSKQRRSAE
jgi:hypothetical protein